MEHLYMGLGLGSVFLGLFGGLGLLMHGFNFITIKHYHHMDDK